MTTIDPQASLYPTDTVDPTPGLTLKFSCVSQVSFACQQNAIAVLHNLTVINSTPTDYRDLRLTMVASPDFVTSKTWLIDHLIPQGDLSIADRDIQLNGTYLLNLTEMQRGTLTFQLTDSTGQLLVDHIAPVEILARNEWGGYGSTPEILAAFCMPNDTAVERLLRSCSDILRENGHDGVLHHYGDAGPDRIWLQASAAWNAIRQLKLDYAYPPPSFDRTGQKIRTPGAILESRRATCIDSALLFAAMFEQMHLRPVIILEEGHAYAGLWLRPDGFARGYLEDPLAVRKRVQLKELIVFETTLVTQGASFTTALKHASDRLLSDDNKFVGVLDIARARDERLRPISFAQPSPFQSNATATDDETTLITAIELPDISVLPEVHDFSTASATPGGRLGHWQRRLLDLTLRNPLLNLRERKTTIPLIVPNPGRLEDLLAQTKEFSIEPKPGQGMRDSQLYAQQRGENLDEEIALAALERCKLYAPIPEEQLTSSLTELYRRARNDLEEGGANTLFLAIGFLRWKRTSDDKTSRAPLILIPVELTRQSVRSGFRISLSDDEPRFNTTLLEMLRQDFELDIQGLDGPLPVDELGTDISHILTKVRVAVRDVAGFEVVDEVVLSTLSFAKYLMWKDLVDRSEQLKTNAVVRHLIETPREPFVDSQQFVDPAQLDTLTSPDKVFTPLGADSSQLAAVIASSQGKNFVMIGPPGTGKSQTISNMIAHNLALGRTVLFVSEKAAALDVVYRRLREQGLGSFCLELHSNKAKKLDVIQQLGRAWEARSHFDEEEWTSRTRELHILRNDLNHVVRELHTTHPNGLSIRSALSTAVDGATVPPIMLQWSDANTHTDEFRLKLLAVGERLDLNSASLGDIGNHPLKSVHAHDWSLGWQQSLLQQASVLSSAAAAWSKCIAQIIERLRLRSVEYGQQIRALTALVRVLQASAGKDVAFAFRPNANEVIAALEKAVALIEEFTTVYGKLSVRYDRDRLLQLDHVSLRTQYENAQQSWWLIKLLRLRSVRNRLKSAGGTRETPDINTDLTLIARLQNLYEQLLTIDPLLDGIIGWRRLDSSPADLHLRAVCGTELRSATAALATDQDTLTEIRRSIQSLVVDANDLLAPDGLLGGQLSDYLARESVFTDALSVYASLAQQPAEDIVRDAGSLDDLIAYGSRLSDSQPVLNAWCAWRRARNDAVDIGLQPIVDAVESGALASGSIRRAIEVNYARWWVTGQIDASSILRTFVSIEHDRKIERFRELDEQIRKITAQCISVQIQKGIVDKDSVTRSSEYGIIRRELEKKRRHKPLRQLISEAPNAIPALTPCLLMSPLSIAQYLPVEQQLFDLVVFDEASQITVWDAIGAIARGKQTVVVGDPKQLPPTNFFASGQTEADEISDDEDLESILDEMLGANIPHRNLSWHYRSRNESLITFSNHRYYGNGLVTFPSPVTKDTAVSLHFVGGVYDRGKSQTNRAEAEAIVREIEQRLMDPALNDKTLGVVTFNQKQQTLILDLLDAVRARNVELEQYFSDDRIEPVFVKNLESVQGDERDVILFSTTFGPDHTGRVMMNFGPLNKSGGERRLNVAITRARYELKVFSSIKADDINLNRTATLGVRDLKHFLDFADRGPRALSEAIFGSVGEFESAFESAVARDLQQKGWAVHPQVGVSRFRIDLGVVHPEIPGRYLAGIECDGATYHRAATARDRDLVRESVLRGLGWQIVRLWSTDYWINPVGAIDKIDAKLRELLERHF